MMRLKTCDCGPAFLIRINGSWWMRLMTTRRLYYCARCDTELFLTRRHLHGAGADSSRPALSSSPSIAQDTSLQG